MPALSAPPTYGDHRHDDGKLPTRGGQRPHLVLTMGLNDLIDGLGTALLDTGGCITASEARRLACDAYLIPMVLGSDSMPLDVGRQQRLATAALRDALTQRDRGCAFPSCDRPPPLLPRPPHHFVAERRCDKTIQYVPVM
ncbi:MAG TPA: DUF222 domain-containing protein [Pseudonocardiaceae bacterium]|nr:DUF222 domain-containing protein [Pseudonocardiaceae bacterium]